MTADTLTPAAVLAMPAGEMMDELVATRVLGWRKELYRAATCDSPTYWTTASGAFVAKLCPLLSDDLGAAEPVFDWLRERWGQVEIVYDRTEWCVWRIGTEPHFAAPTLPLALCRAALLEVMAEGKS